MPTVEKTLGILGLFTPTTPIWTADALIAYLESPTSTGYRHIKSLQDSGFLARVGSGSYILGPRVLELDRTVRLSDPVYIAGTSVIEGLSRETGHGTALVALYSDSIVCVRRQLTPSAPNDLFGRGDKRPLIGGASAMAILAWLQPHQLRRIYIRHAEAIARVGLGGDWPAFKAELRRIRRDGFALSVGAYDADVTALAAPFFNRDEEVLGSLLLVVKASTTDKAAVDALVPLVMQAAEAVTGRIAELDGFSALPARAVG